PILPVPFPTRRSSDLVDPLVSVAPSLGQLETVDRDSARPTFRDFFVDVVGNDSSIAAFDRMVEDAGFHAVDNFNIGSIPEQEWRDRKSTRLNSSHVQI